MECRSVGPDVGKSSYFCPKSSPSGFYTKAMLFEIAQKVTKNWATFAIKFVSKDLSENSPICSH